jgi:hypothetical protein
VALEIATTNACFGASVVMVAEAKKVASTDLTKPEQKRAETAMDATLAMKKVLTPTFGIGKRLICGPSLVKKHHWAGNFPQSIR